MKERYPKSYRIKEIDTTLNKKRTQNEVNFLKKVKKYNLLAPKVIEVNYEKNIIYMEYLKDCITLKEKIDKIIKKEVESNLDELMYNLGKNVASIHNLEIIHGDLTTSNFIINDKNELFVIDFGLSYTSKTNENRAVDLYVLERAFICSHSKIEDKFSLCLKGYEENIKIDNSKIIIERLNQVRARGRKKIAFG